MYEVLLFAGTAEGRKIAEYMEEQGIRALVFVATEYGESLISSGPSLQVEWGRLSEAGMEEKMEASPGALVIDASLCGGGHREYPDGLPEDWKKVYPCPEEKSGLRGMRGGICRKPL